MEHEKAGELHPNGPAVETGQKLRELRRELGDVAGAMYDTAESAIEDLRKSGSRTLERLYDDSRRQVRNLSRRVQDQPIQSVVLAAGAGVLAGLILRRWGFRSSKRSS